MFQGKEGPRPETYLQERSLKRRKEKKSKFIHRIERVTWKNVLYFTLRSCLNYPHLVLTKELNVPFRFSNWLFLKWNDPKWSMTNFGTSPQYDRGTEIKFPVKSWMKCTKLSSQLNIAMQMTSFWYMLTWTPRAHLPRGHQGLSYSYEAHRKGIAFLNVWGMLFNQTPLRIRWLSLFCSSQSLVQSLWCNNVMWTSRKVSRWENVSQYLRLLLKGKNVQEQNLKVTISWSARRNEMGGWDGLVTLKPFGP